MCMEDAFIVSVFEAKLIGRQVVLVKGMGMVDVVSSFHTQPCALQKAFLFYL